MAQDRQDGAWIPGVYVPGALFSLMICLIDNQGLPCLKAGFKKAALTRVAAQHVEVDANARAKEVLFVEAGLAAGLRADEDGRFQMPLRLRRNQHTLNRREADTKHLGCC